MRSGSHLPSMNNYSFFDFYFPYIFSIFSIENSYQTDIESPEAILHFIALSFKNILSFNPSGY